MFCNNSKQENVLIETDYIEDIYDSILAFFDEKHFRPHFLKVLDAGEDCRVDFGSMSEYFQVTGVTYEDIEELKQLIIEAD